MNDLHTDDPLLTSALRAVAEDDRRLGASAAVEARVLADVRLVARSRRTRARVAMLAAAAALFAAVALPLWPRAGDAPVVGDRAAAATAVDAGGGEIATEFFPWPTAPCPRRTATRSACRCRERRWRALASRRSPRQGIPRPPSSPR
jgi:hypothetical protein